MKNVLNIDYSPSGARVFISGTYNGKDFSFSYVGTGESVLDWVVIVLNRIGVEVDDPTLAFDEIYNGSELFDLFAAESFESELDQEISDLRPFGIDEVFTIVADLYNKSALTFEGLTVESVPEALEYLDKESGLKAKAYIFSGKQMNEIGGLTDRNAYPEDVHIVSFENTGTILALSIGARWLDDIIDNNARRQNYHPFDNNFIEEEEHEEDLTDYESEYNDFDNLYNEFEEDEEDQGGDYIDFDDDLDPWNENVESEKEIKDLLENAPNKVFKVRPELVKAFSKSGFPDLRLIPDHIFKKIEKEVAKNFAMLGFLHIDTAEGPIFFKLEPKDEEMLEQYMLAAIGEELSIEKAKNIPQRRYTKHRGGFPGTAKKTSTGKAFS